MTTENASQNEIVWNGQVLHQSIQEYGSEIGIWNSDAKLSSVYEIYSRSINPQMEAAGWDSDDNEKRVAGENLYFCRDYDQGTHTNGEKDIYDNIHSTYCFPDKELIIGISAMHRGVDEDRKTLEVYLRGKKDEHSIALEYNPETGELETIELPFKTGTPEDDQPIFYPRVKYNLKLKTYVGREDEPLRTDTRKPEVISYKKGYTSIKFNIEGLQQMTVVPSTLKVNHKDPFDQFTDLNSNDWVSPKLLEALDTISSV